MAGTNKKLIAVWMMLGAGVIVMAAWFYSRPRAVEAVTVINKESPVSVNAEINTQTISVLSRQLDWERRRYGQLQAAYNMVASKQQNTEAIKNQVTILAKELSELQVYINDIQKLAEQIDGDANAEKRQLVYNKNSSQAALEDQIIAVQSGQTTTDPAQRQIDKNNIISSMKNIERATENRLLETAQLLQDSQIQILSEKQDLQRQATDVKSELDYWNQQIAGAGDQQARLNRIENLKKEMAEQERKVGRIQQQLATY